MARIEDLPVELLLIIFSFIATPTPIREGYEGYVDDELESTIVSRANEQARKRLCSLSLVSPLFKTVAQSLLFRSFQEDSLSLDNTVSFTRALCTNPGLNESVKELMFLPFLGTELDADNEFSASDHNLFKHILDGKGLSHLGWIPKLHRRKVDIFAAFVAIQTPQLRKLALKGNISLAPFVQASAHLQPFLPYVREVTVASNPDLGRIDIGGYSSIYSLFSNLDAVSFKFGSLQGLGETFNCEVKTLNAKQIKFEMCHLTSGGLQKVIRAHKKLSSFIYNNFDSESQWRPFTLINGALTDPHFDAAEGLEALLTHKESLQTFHLTLQRPAPLMGYESIAQLRRYYSAQARFGSFAAFDQLKSLVVAQCNLSDHPEFPVSIEKIEIIDCIAPYEGLVLRIASDCANGKYPQLTAISMIIEYQYNSFFEDGRTLQGQDPGRIPSWFSGVDVTFVYTDPWSAPVDQDWHLPWPMLPDQFLEHDQWAWEDWVEHREEYVAFQKFLRLRR